MSLRIRDRPRSIRRVWGNLRCRPTPTPCAPIQTIDEGVRYAQEVGLAPVVEVGDSGLPMIRNPITFSSTPARYDLAPPEIDQDGAQIRAWLAGAAGEVSE